ncbi:MAG: InlB B-repeat-containing protein [Bacteroidales bacterium]|nr:InlB B-repeat-containing protein [Bacteroidales bacterium]
MIIRKLITLFTVLMLLATSTASAQTQSSTTIGGTDYTLFTGFTATAGTKTYANFVDGNTSTKWQVMKNLGENARDFAGGEEDPAYVEFHADAPFIPKGYILTYDNSVNENWKPTSWALKAKLNESDNWTTIHSSNSSLGSGSRFEIACNNDGDNMYQYFRFEIYDVGSTYQSILSELEFYGNTGFIHLTPKVATCTETGIKQECWYSNGKYFSDANGTTELDESAVVEPMKAHNCLHHEASATNTEYWQCSVCGKCFSDEACTNEISEAEALIGVFGAIVDGRYTLTSQTYTLTDDVNTAGYIYVPEGVTATIDLNGHTIDRGLTSADNNGSVIIVKGTLTIKDSGTDGKVQGGYDAGDGYGYYTSCVKVLEGATFNLQGGTLIGRVRDYDYTVSVVENSNFTMTGGKITGGWTGVLAVGDVTLTGGEISGNNKGVRVGENFSISGNPVITENTKMNVDLVSSWQGKIIIIGALTEGANIGITAPTPTNNAPVTVTSGYGTYNSEPVSTYFSLDNDGQIQTSPFDYMTVVMGWNEDRTEIAVGTATRTVTFDLQGHGSDIEAVSLLNGYKLIEPTEPTAEGWSFGGWYTDANCTDDSEWSFNSGVTSDMTLYALWAQGQTYRVTLPENMLLVSADNEAVGGKYPTGTNIRFKVKSADYVVDGDVKNGEDVLTADGNGIYTVTVGNADITITATVKKAVEANKELSGSESYTAQNGDVLTGSTSGTVTIPDGESITLSDVNITGGIVCNGTATITLVGTNSVSGATNKAGIQIGGSGTTLTIKGNGSLTANGGDQSAGIGLSRAWDVDNTGGNIVIEGGNITANGGSKWGAGIGTGVIFGNGSAKTARIGNITIKGGTVKATGGSDSDGIGTGYTYYGCTNAIGTVTIYDGIDKIDASSIKNSGSIVYKHEENDVTASTSDYFTIIENGNRRIIVQKVTPTIADVPDQTYTGSAITPEPLVLAGLLNLTKGTDYEYSYTNNTNVGTIAKVTVTFNGDYASLGSVEKEFNIIPKVTELGALTLTQDQNGITAVIDGNSTESLSIDSEDGIEVKSVTYSRTFTTDGGAYTIMLPFGFDVTSDIKGTFHTLSTLEPTENETVWKATMSEAITTIEANKPYIFVPSEDFDEMTFENVTLEKTTSAPLTNVCENKNWKLHGVYSKKTWTDEDENLYGFAAAAKDDIAVGEFVHFATGATLKATRCYLEYSKEGFSKSAAVLPERIILVFPDETASVIEPNDPENNNGDITTPVSEIAPNNGVKVWSYDGTIYIESQPDTDYTIIDLTGRTLLTGVTTSTRETVTLSRRTAGIVIVKINGKTFKVNY